MKQPEHLSAIKNHRYRLKRAFSLQSEMPHHADRSEASDLIDPEPVEITSPCRTMVMCGRSACSFSSRNKIASRALSPTPVRSISFGHCWERHGTAGHRGAGLAIRRGQAGPAGRRRSWGGDVTLPGAARGVTAADWPATAFLDAIRDPAHERHAASATLTRLRSASRPEAAGILGGPLELPGGSKASIRMVRHFALEGKNPF